MERDTSRLEFYGPERIDDCDVYEAVDRSADDPAEHIYSCVAICRTDWKPDWPALGGTRWHGDPGDDPAAGQEEARREAVELAGAMYLKNTLLRRAASDGAGGAGELYGWQGGKGVIWSPYRQDLPDEENKRRYLTPRRLISHGRLLQHLHGEYIGSKDAGIGTQELKWIERSTRYTIGNGCRRDTGEATATGILAGLEGAVRQLAASGELDAELDGDPLAGVRILVAGVGKVGLPLAGMLHRRGAEVYLYEPELASGTAGIDPFLESRRATGAELVGLGDPAPDYGEALREVDAAGRIFRGEGAEVEALGAPGIQVVSPCGGRTGWLSTGVVDEGPSRAELLAAAAREHGDLRLVLGAGNDQVPISDSGRQDRESALRTLERAGVHFVPDPLVSPGGVIAVSHELASEWRAERVNADSAKIVRRTVERFFERHRELVAGDGHGTTSSTWRTLRALVDEAWG